MYVRVTVTPQSLKRAAVDPSGEDQQAHVTESLPSVGGRLMTR